MFEFDQKSVASLLSEDPEFRKLYDKHAELDRQVIAASSGSTFEDDVAVHDLKKAKLETMDQMARIIEGSRSAIV